MDKELTKSLNDLIDETLSELEELRKSRFSASEIKIEGPGDGIAGKPANGDLHAKKEDKDEDDKEDKDMDKGEGKNREADPDGGHHKPVAGEGMKHGQGPSESPGGHGEQPKGGTNRQADPNGGRHEMDKAEDKDDKKKSKKENEEGSPEHEEKEKEMAKKLLAMHKAEMDKSAAEHETLMKSYVEEKIQPLEAKLSTILDLVNKLSEQPVAPKGVTANTQPLFKSGIEANGGESLSKAQVADKLFELKKSGTYVDSMDVAKAEMGTDLESIVRKYKIS
jgi:hypothetical protein